jgi:hypothetical protein
MKDNETSSDEVISKERLPDIVARLHREVCQLKREIQEIKANADFLNDPMLDSATVCQFLCISYRQLKTYKQRGDITPIYNGSKCIYPTSEVRRFVDNVLRVKGKKTKTIIKQRDEEQR